MDHAIHHASRPGLRHASPYNVTPVTPARADRLARKRWVRAELEARGESKQDYIASVLGVSQQYVARCLSEHHRDEFSESHLERLGLGRRAA